MTDQLTLTQPLTGCVVTAQGTADMTVHVADGAVLVANAAVTVAADDLTITAADATQDRRDAVVADSTGAVGVLDGAIRDGSDVFPPDTTGYALLAYVDVVNQARADYTGTITDDVITNRREFALVHVSPYTVSGQWYGPTCQGVPAASWTNQDMYLCPFFVGKGFAVQAVGTEVLGGASATAGSKARFGIYQDNGAGVLTLLVDGGQAAVDAGAGDASVAVSEVLTPGWWWLAIAFQSLGATKPSISTITAGSLAGGNSPIGGSSLSNVSSGRYGAIKFSGISGALPATPTSPTYSASPMPAVWVQAT